MFYLPTSDLYETPDICAKKLFQNPKTLVKGGSKNDFCDLLNLAKFLH